MKTLVLCSVLHLGLMLGTATGIVYEVVLDTEQEIPTPTLNGRNPTGSATVDVNTITGAVSISGSYGGMTSDVQAAHLHGMSDAGATAGVVFGLNVSGGLAGTFSGSDVLAPESLGGLLAGQTYINVHTVNNGPGEIRGQVVDSDIKVFHLILDPSQEVPAPNIDGFDPSGSATVVVDMASGLVEVTGDYTGMTSNVAAGHLHGLAGVGATAGVVFGLDVSGGTAGTFSGSAMLSQVELDGLLGGNTYLNIHTANNGPGEIRAQVVPEPASLVLLIVSASPVVGLCRRKRRRN